MNPTEKTTLDKACSYMLNKEYGEVETVNNHDIGIFILGLCTYTKKPCSNLVLDTPHDYKYNHERCNTYKKHNGGN